jgi:hypothetical protein
MGRQLFGVMTTTKTPDMLPQKQKSEFGACVQTLMLKCFDGQEKP